MEGCSASYLIDTPDNFDWGPHIRVKSVNECRGEHRDLIVILDRVVIPRFYCTL